MLELVVEAHLVHLLEHVIATPIQFNWTATSAAQERGILFGHPSMMAAGGSLSALPVPAFWDTSISRPQSNDESSHGSGVRGAFVDRLIGDHCGAVGTHGPVGVDCRG